MIKKEYEILYLFAKEPWKKYNFTGLQKTSGKKSRSYLEKVLHRLSKDKILKKELFGHMPIYSLNIDSAKVRIYAGFALEYYGWSKKHVPYDNLQKIMDKIPNKEHVFIVAGSYAGGKQTAKSDIDIVILICDSAEPKKVYAELSHYAGLSIPKIHLYVFRHKEFIEMLHNREQNYGKEIAKNNLILTEGQIYIKLVQEAMQNGYNG